MTITSPAATFSDSIAIEWYLSYEVLLFEKADANDESNVLAWENLILIRAANPEEAYDKSVIHGKLSEEQLSIDNEKGYCRFVGIRKLIPIYEELADGSEIEWREFQSTIVKLHGMIPPKDRLQAFQSLTDFEE